MFLPKTFSLRILSKHSAIDTVLKRIIYIQSIQIILFFNVEVVLTIKSTIINSLFFGINIALI